jgi:poly-gamma-glutamate synthesis protein (capsule biosynthesis protein)
MKVEKDGRPFVHGRTKTGQEVFDYVDRITREAGLNARYSWNGDDVVIN